MAKTSQVTVILINWNSGKMIGQALRSLQQQTYRKFDVLAVDNASSDDSVQYIQDEFPAVAILKLEENYGFAGGVNRAVAHVVTPYFALLNTDAVADKNWLAELITVIEERDDLVVVTAKALLSDGKHIDAAGDMMSRWGVAYPRGRGEIDDGQYDQADRIFSGTGGYSLYRLSVWKKLGGFDERFFMYYEDVDYCYRARLGGYTVGFAPRAKIIHEVGTSSQKRGRNFSRKYVLRNASLVYWKNTPRQIIWRTLWRFVIANSYMILAALKAGAFMEIAWAYWQLIVLVPYIMRARRRTPAQHNWRALYSKYDSSWPFKKVTSA